jgi:hypothetical protein
VSGSPDKVCDSSAVPPPTAIYGSTGSCIPHHLSGWLPYMGPPIRIGAWEISPVRRLGDRATFCRLRGSPCRWPICHNELSSGHWPASGAGGHTSVCHVHGPLNLPCDWLWVIPCRRCPRQQVAMQSEFSSEYLASWSQDRSVMSECPVSREEDR